MTDDVSTSPATADSAPVATVAVTSAPADPDHCVPRSLYRAEDGTLRRDLHPRELADAVALGTGALWVDIDSTNRHQFALLEKLFHFHPLAIEDALNPNSRVKAEEYDTFLLVVVRGVRFCDTTDDPYDLDTVNLNFFLGKNYLVSVHGTDAATVMGAFERAGRAETDVLARGAAKLLHDVVDVTVDGYFPILDRIDEFIDGLEQRVFVQFDQSALRDIFSLKRLVLSLRRHLAPQREVLNALANRPSVLLRPETQLYFRDVYDHVLRINDSLDVFRELLSSILDSYLTQVSNRLGQTTKALSVIATITLPFVMVSGMWGMNFAHIPLSTHSHGFALMVALQLALAAAILLGLRWRKVI